MLQSAAGYLGFSDLDAELDTIFEGTSHDRIDGRGPTDVRPLIPTPAVIDASAFQLLLALLAGWLDRQERKILRYLLEENRVLRRQLRGRRLQLTDDDRRRLAVRAYRLV